MGRRRVEFSDPSGGEKQSLLEEILASTGRSEAHSLSLRIYGLLEQSESSDSETQTPRQCQNFRKYEFSFKFLEKIPAPIPEKIPLPTIQSWKKKEKRKKSELLVTTTNSVNLQLKWNKKKKKNKHDRRSQISSSRYTTKLAYQQFEVLQTIIQRNKKEKEIEKRNFKIPYFDIQK